MARLLFLAHRLPYPPNKGDKVRSYHLLRHLSARHEVYLGTFVDDPDDWQHLPHVRSLCADCHVASLSPRAARMASLTALLTGGPLTLRYYRDRGLHTWVRNLVRRERLDAAVVFSSSMIPYAVAHATMPMLVDFVDVDSAKWTAYSQRHRGPLSWLYRLEGQRLLAYERAAALLAQRSFFVTEQETALFRALAPECAARVDVLGNGVDAEYFAPDPKRTSPFAPGEQALVFTGAMDYWPNVDAATWFSQELLPMLRRRFPAVRFYIVGRSPSAAVQALASPAVTVTGTVPDVRPYLQHAALVVAPLRLARGIQNKILEAMAMARAVVTTANCAVALDAQLDMELVAANGSEGFVAEVESLLAEPNRAEAMGQAARDRVVSAYSWSARLAALEGFLPGERGVPTLSSVSMPEGLPA